MARLIARAALCLAIAVPPLTVVWLIASYGHNIPFMEEWITTGDVAIRAASGQFTVADLFGTWKDHRMLLLNAIAAGNAVIFGWNLTLQQIATVMIAAVSWSSSDWQPRVAWTNISSSVASVLLRRTA